MKITVLGGGGMRSMFLAKSIAQKAKRLGIDELCFMDNDREKLRIYVFCWFFVPQPVNTIPHKRIAVPVLNIV